MAQGAQRRLDVAVRQRAIDEEGWGGGDEALAGQRAAEQVGGIGFALVVGFCNNYSVECSGRLTEVIGLFPRWIDSRQTINKGDETMTHEHSDNFEELAQELLERRDGVKRLLEELLNAAMTAEVSEQLGAERHEHNPSARAGAMALSPRQLKTRVGELRLRVPQVGNSEPYHPSMLARCQRSERAPPAKTARSGRGRPPVALGLPPPGPSPNEKCYLCPGLLMPPASEQSRLTLRAPAARIALASCD